MSDVTVYGFAPSTYVRTARLALEEKGVAYDLAPVELGSEEHLQLQPFGKIPAFRHGDFYLYETGAIARYVDAAFEGPALQPADPRARAVMDQWVSATCDYYYDAQIRVLVFERLVHPSRGKETDEARIAEAMPRIENQLMILERQLADGRAFVTGQDLSLADLFLVPILDYVRVTPEGRGVLEGCPAIRGWSETLAARPSFAATEPAARQEAAE